MRNKNEYHFLSLCYGEVQLQMIPVQLISRKIKISNYKFDLIHLELIVMVIFIFIRRLSMSLDCV